MAKKDGALPTKSEYLNLLIEISGTLATLHDSKTLFQKITDFSVELLKLGSAAMYLLDGEKLRLEATYPPLPADFPDNFRNAAQEDHPRIQQAILSGEPVLVADTRNAPQTPAEKEIYKLRGLRSLLFLPLVYKGKRLGVLIVGSVGEPYEFSADDVNVCQSLANLSSLQIEETRQYEANQKSISMLKREIEERRRTESNLQESEARFRLLIENAPDGIFVQTDHKFAYLNPAATHLFGAGNAEVLLGTPVLERFHPDYHAIVKERIRNLIVDKFDVPTIEEVFLRMDGKPFDVEVSAVPFQYEGKDGALVYFRDISERKQAEAELTDEANRRRLLMEQSRDGIVILDQDGQVYESNRKFAEMLGYPLKSMSRLNVRDWDYLYPPERVMEMIQSVDEKGDHFETRHRHSDGSTYDVEISTNAAWFGGQKLVLCICRDITKRKQAEAALQQSNERTHAILNAASESVFLMDLDGRVLDTNETAAQRFGKSSADLTGANIYDLLPPELAEIRKEKVQEVVRESKPQRFEDRQADRWFEHSIYPVVDSQGNVTGVAVYAQDITDRRFAEEALKEREERFRQLAENAQDLIYRVRLSKPRGFEYVSPSATAITGYTPEELYEDPDMGTKLAHPDDRPLTEAITAGKADLTQPQTLRWVRKDGEEIWTEQRNVPIFDSEGKLVAMEGIARDITERKQAEKLAQELLIHKEAAASLKHREAILSAVALSAERLLVCDDWESEMDTILAQLGEAAAASRTVLFQSVKEESGEILTSWRFEWCAPGIPSQIKHVKLQNFSLPSGGFGRWQRLLEKGEMIRGPVKSFPKPEREVLTSQMIQSILVIPIFAHEKLWGQLGMEQSESEREWSNVEVDALTTAARMIGIAIERKEAKSALLLAQQDLIEKEKLATLGQLAGGVGHELRNPLGVINNAVYILKATVAQENEKAREYADMIAQQVHRSNKIISDLLNFAREPGTNPAEIDLSALVARVLADFPPPEGVKVRKTIAKGQPKALADEQQAEQILANLISNAYQAMPEGGHVSVSASCKQGEVRIAVRDSGTGISKENMGKLFVPLFTTKAKGIGLGLATSRKLAEANGGRIEVKSQEGKGSTFTLVLPAAGGEDGA